MSTPSAAAGAAIAHFFIGLMKADGIITPAEKTKVKILAHKFQRNLPCNEDEVMSAQEAILDNSTHNTWMPKEHLDAGFGAFDTFVNTETANEDHISAILEMLEILAEVDGVTDTEMLYLDMIREGMSARYGITV